MDPPPQSDQGSIITAVAALAKKHKMYVVAPIRELRDGVILNTAIVVGRDGAVVGNCQPMTTALS